MRIQGYDTNIRKPGKEMLLADGIYRLPARNAAHTIELDLKVDHVQFSHLEVKGDRQRRRLNRATRRHHILMARLSQTTTQRPQPQLGLKDELSIEDRGRI